jgi:hypothetical protein
LKSKLFTAIPILFAAIIFFTACGNIDNAGVNSISSSNSSISGGIETETNQKPGQITNRQTEQTIAVQDIYSLLPIGKAAAVIKFSDSSGLHFGLYDVVSAKFAAQVLDCGNSDKLLGLENGVAVLRSASKKLEIYDEGLMLLNSFSLPGDDYSSYCISTDGTQLAYNTQNDDGTGALNIYTIHTGTIKEILKTSLFANEGQFAGFTNLYGFVNGKHVLFDGLTVKRKTGSGVEHQNCYGSVSLSGSVAAKAVPADTQIFGSARFMLLCDSQNENKSTDGNIQILDASTGDSLSFSFLTGNESQFDFISSNGKYIASSVLSGNSANVVIYNIKTGQNQKAAYPTDLSTTPTVALFEESSVALIGVGNKIYKVQLEV